MQDWKMENTGLEFDGLTMRVRLQKTQLNKGSCHEH